MRRIFEASGAGLRDAGKREQYSLPLNEARGNFCSRWLALVRRFRLQPLEPIHEQGNTPGPKHRSITEIPVTISQNVPSGAQQSPCWRTMIWLEIGRGPCR